MERIEILKENLSTPLVPEFEQQPNDFAVFHQHGHPKSMVGCFAPKVKLNDIVNNVNTNNNVKNINNINNVNNNNINDVNNNTPPVSYGNTAPIVASFYNFPPPQSDARGTL